MSKRLLSLSAAVLVAASFAVSNVASAAPVIDALAIKNAAQSDVQTVRWGRGVGWGIGAGLLGGAIIGGALAAPYYGGGYGYYPPAYGYGYGPGYYPAPAYGYPAPGYGGGDGVAYCARKYRSYDPSTGTFLGNDGARHSCP
jgi:hypothetical protein